MLIVSFIGFQNDTIHVSSKNQQLDIVLRDGVELNEVNIVTRKLGTMKLRSSVMNEDMISSAELSKGISDRLTRGESLLEQHHVPMDGTYSYLDVDGASVINMGSKSFPKNVRALHEFIYGEYIPAD